MKPLILPLVAVGSLALAGASILRTTPTRAATEPPSPPPVSPFERTVAAVGLVEASTENIAIGVNIPGIVARVSVVVGSRVRAGDPLFQIDDREAQAQAAVRRAGIGIAEAQLRDARNQLALAERVTDKRALSVEERDRRRFAVEIAEARLADARAALEAVETDLERLTVRAPIDGEALKVNVRKGEYAPAGVLPAPLVLLGDVEDLHVRVDVDEHEAWRVRPAARATAQVRGNAALRTPLAFVRLEPFVVPKRSLTGDGLERVDTRVLQVIYRIERRDLPLFTGQQMDVFIDAAPGEGTS